MTTPARANLYLAQHLAEMEGKPYAVHNPHNGPVDSLPIIFGFNNGGSHGWYNGVLMAQDGTRLGGHLCSHESYMPYDLGVLEGTRRDRHVEFQAHYPDGYRMVFVPGSKVKQTPELMEALRLNQEMARKAKEQSQ